MSRWRRPATWTLREAGKGPVVTSAGVTRGSAPFPLSEVDGRGAESGMVGLRLTKTRISRCGEWFARQFAGWAFLSLRRYDPDQVQRVSAPRKFRASDISAPSPGHPLDRAIIRRVPARRQGNAYFPALDAHAICAAGRCRISDRTA